MSSAEKEYKKVQERLVRATTLRDESMRRLKEDFDCSTLGEAQKKADSLETWIEEKEEEIERRLKKLKRDHPSIFEDS
jgi:hypothetical protein